MKRDRIAKGRLPDVIDGPRRAFDEHPEGALKPRFGTASNPAAWPTGFLTNRSRACCRPLVPSSVWPTFSGSAAIGEPRLAVSHSG